MAEIELDKETRDAVQALAWRLKNREPGTDDEVFAQEFMTALRGHGWRPTQARVLPDWHYRDHGAEPGEEYRAAKAALLARPENRTVQDDVTGEHPAIGAPRAEAG